MARLLFVAYFLAACTRGTNPRPPLRYENVLGATTFSQTEMVALRRKPFLRSTCMNTDRRGEWLWTFTGRQFWPLDPRPEDFDIRDIAHALSLEPRFAGHTREHYSVGQHSLLVAAEVDRLLGEYSAPGNSRSPLAHKVVLAALLHDASEAYLKDIPRPFKRDPAMAGYCEAEERVQNAIRQWAGLTNIPHGLIEAVDQVALYTEQRDLLAVPIPANLLPGVPRQTLKQRIVPSPPDLIERAFLERFAQLRP